MLFDGSLIIGSGLLIALAAHNTQVALRPTSPADEACARFFSCQSGHPLPGQGGRLSLSILLIWHFSLGNALSRFGLNPEAILATCVSTGSSWTMRPRRPSASTSASRQLLEQVIGCIRKVQWADATGLNEGTLKYSHCSEEENGHTDTVLNSTRCGAEEDVGE